MTGEEDDRRRDKRGAGRLDFPNRAEDAASLGENFGPAYVILIDTEEEFDWENPNWGHDYDTKSVPALAEGQKVLRAAGAKPAYMVDYPIATDPVACDLLGGWAEAGEASVGIQLHPWVNPPHDEELNIYNSFSGNLPAELEEQKLQNLIRAIRDNIGVDPISYRAGRYGIGPNSAAMLERNGVLLDSSVRASFSYAEQGGPDFSAHKLLPYWAGPTRRLLEMPLGVAHSGLLSGMADSIFTHVGEHSRMRGVLARLGLLQRIPLTPEGTTVDEVQEAIRHLVDTQAPLLAFSFHSPSLEVGHTPYVRDEADLKTFYQWWHGAFDLMAKLGVRATSVEEIVSAAWAQRPDDGDKAACQARLASATRSA